VKSEAAVIRLSMAAKDLLFMISLVLTVAQAAARKKSEPAVVEESSGFSGLPNELYFAAAFTAGALIVGSALSFKEKKRPPTPKGLLYGNPVSTCSRRVITALAEINADFKFKKIDLTKGEQKDPEFLKIQPFGKVPVWEEAASFRIFESRAILKHVSFGSSIYPADNPRLAGTIEQWVSVEYSYFYPAWMPIFVEKILKPRKDKSYQADMKIVEAKKQELLPTLDLLNTHLADNTFLGGDCFTVADITFMPYIALFGAAGLADVFESRPNLARWKEEILSRDSWKYAAENKVAEKFI